MKLSDESPSMLVLLAETKSHEECGYDQPMHPGETIERMHRVGVLLAYSLAADALEQASRSAALLFG